ncbi:1926_t:CDS:1, partial [Acaulospora colombiana]
FVAVMSDATGFGTGGTSPILTVNSGNSSSCIPRTPSEPEFYLYLSSTSLNQCGSVHISWDRPASPPVTVYGVIPQGQSFDLNAASKVGSGIGFDWTVNIKSGTPFFFVAGDRNGSGKGGSTDVQSIGGGSSRCIDANSPSATADSGVGSVGQLPNASGTPTPTSSGTNDP